jgi:hypothetical protein
MMLFILRISEKLEVMKCVEFDKDVFRDFVLKHPNMLYPVFEIQKQIKKSILGIRYWDEYSARRIEMCDGKYLSIAQIIKLLNEKAIQEKLKQNDKARITDALDFEELLTDKKPKWYQSKKPKKEVHIKGSVTSTSAVHESMALRNDKGGVYCLLLIAYAAVLNRVRNNIIMSIEIVAKTDVGKADPSWLGSLKRALFGAKVASEPSSGSSARGRSLKNMVPEIDPNDPRPSAKKARAAAEEAAKRDEGVKVAKSQEDLNIMVDSFGPLTKRRQKALSSKYSSGEVGGPGDEEATASKLEIYYLL